MTLAVYLVIAASAATFGIATAIRAARYARSPLHLRWELYPIPHEASGRVAYGGSYFETSEWWRVPRAPRRIGELRAMVVEILFLKALGDHNRALWRRSFPFHLGLYLLACACALVLLAALFALVGRAPAGLLRGLSAVTGVAGLSLTAAGSAALLHRRLTDPQLRPYTSHGDIFNLGFFLGALGLLGVGYVTREAGSSGPVAVVTGLLTWDLTRPVAPVFAAGLIAASLLVAYIPFTHMSHYVGKYFTYHQVRWDDAPLREDRRTSATMAEQLAYGPTWSAPHIRTNGATTWAEIAATNPAAEERR